VSADLGEPTLTVASAYRAGAKVRAADNDMPMNICGTSFGSFSGLSAHFYASGRQYVRVFEAIALASTYEDC
jgi:hypothetical protein